jgi:hypothetical protein
MSLALGVLLMTVAASQAAPPAARKGGSAGAPGPSAARVSATEEAERLAAEATALVATDPARAVAQARRALALTDEFEPTAFVKAGRKGEVVEDAFVAARQGYTRHRAVLYEAVGSALAAAGQPLAASRYLRRASLLDAKPARGLALARVLVELGRGREALEVLRKATDGFSLLDAAGVPLLARAADLAGLPSVQAEIDRGRLEALGKEVELREGPLELPPGTRLSNAPVFRLAETPVMLVYAAEASCHSCSADLEELARLVPKEVRVATLPPGDDQDAALRQVLGLYRRPWPLLVGHDLARQLGLRPRSALLVARGGWVAAVLHAPFSHQLSSAITALLRTDVQEQLPRPQWNRRPPDRSPLPPQPDLLPEGLAPGEDEPAPPEFIAAVAAFRGGRHLEAARLFDTVAAKGDGWLLPPELRLDRALCLAGAGQRDAARRLLLRTGDSRFEEGIDRLLFVVAGSR